MFDEVKEVLVDSLSCDENAVTMDAVIIDDLGADSLDIVELSLALEEKFDITIPEEDLANIKTVADVVNYIESKKN